MSNLLKNIISHVCTHEETDEALVHGCIMNVHSRCLGWWWRSFRLNSCWTSSSLPPHLKHQEQQRLAVTITISLHQSVVLGIAVAFFFSRQFDSSAEFLRQLQVRKSTADVTVDLKQVSPHLSADWNLWKTRFTRFPHSFTPCDFTSEDVAADWQQQCDILSSLDTKTPKWKFCPASCPHWSGDRQRLLVIGWSVFYRETSTWEAVNIIKPWKVFLFGWSSDPDSNGFIFLFVFLHFHCKTARTDQVQHLHRQGQDLPSLFLCILNKVFIHGTH